MSNLTLAGLGERIGQELGVSDWVAIEQARIDTFASCTGDNQWIHVDVERARRESPFRGPIAHGYLTLSMVAPLAMQIGVIPQGRSGGPQLWDRQGSFSGARAGWRPRAATGRSCRSRAERRWASDHEDPEHA